MRSSRTARVHFDILAVMLVLGTLVPIAWAQTESPPTPWIGESNAELILILLSIVVLVLVAGAKAIDLKRKREDEAVRLQAQISDAVLRDPALFSLPITPTAHVPLWKGSPVTVEVAGQVPSDDLREVALRVVEREATHLRPDVRIESRIGVVPTMAQRSA